MGNPVVHFEIAGKDSATLRSFYNKLFNWELQVWEKGDYAMVPAQAPDSIGGGIGSTPPGMNPYVTFYVQVDDLDTALKQAESLGGKTIMPPQPIPGIGSMAWFADPEGNCIGLFKGM